MSRRVSSADLLALQDNRFVEFARGLSAGQWAAASLCAGWSNRDVLAHLVVGCSASPVEVGQGIIRHGGSFDRANTALAQGLARRQGAPALLDCFQQLTRRPRGIGRVFPRALLLGDHVLHELDMVLPLGATPDIDPQVIARVLDTEVSISNPFVPARRTAAGLDLHATDAPWSRERPGCPTVTGPGWALASVLANRPHALNRLTGPGVPVLARRLAQTTGATRTPSPRSTS